MTASQHTIAGTVLTMPVNVRKATQHTAMFAVDADATQRMIDYSGLQVYRPLPGRAIVTLILTHFVDSDLGAYHEYSTCVSVNPPESKPSLRSLQTAYVHHMFVDQAFTLEAGRTIWGFPKVMADYTIRDGKEFGFDATIDGQLVIGMEFFPGLKVPAAVSSRKQELSSVFVSRRRPSREPVRDDADGRALPAGRCAAAARRSPLRERTCVARLAETRTGFDFV